MFEKKNAATALILIHFCHKGSLVAMDSDEVSTVDFVTCNLISTISVFVVKR